MLNQSQELYKIKTYITPQGDGNSRLLRITIFEYKIIKTYVTPQGDGNWKYLMDNTNTYTNKNLCNSARRRKQEEWKNIDNYVIE